jgi:hypothetical protein
VNYLAVRNWKKYQHYKDRTPIWIKFHLETLNDDDLKALPIETRLLWDQMLLLAAMFQNSVANDPELIGKLTGIPSEVCREGVAKLIKGRYLREKASRRSASKSASLEKSRREKENARAKDKAIREAAEKFVHEEAAFKDNLALRTSLKDEFGLVVSIADELVHLAEQERKAS